MWVVKLPYITERLVAYAAWVRFISCVRSSVGFQVAIFTERIVAYLCDTLCVRYFSVRSNFENPLAGAHWRQTLPTWHMVQSTHKWQFENHLHWTICRRYMSHWCGFEQFFACVTWVLWLLVTCVFWLLMRSLIPFHFFFFTIWKRRRHFASLIKC